MLFSSRYAISENGGKERKKLFSFNLIFHHQQRAKMLMKTSIILFLMLITFSVGGGNEGLLKGNNIWTRRMPSRLQTRNITNSFHPYILNGNIADIADYPFKLSLRMFGEFICGASVIGSKWSLTAAHCLEWRISPELVKRNFRSRFYLDSVSKEKR